MPTDVSAGPSAALAGPKVGRRISEHAQLAAWLMSDSPADRRRAFCGVAVILLGTFGLMMLHGPALQMFCGHDAIGFLASAWKVRGGLLPHADFHTAPGALNSWIHASGMWLLGPTAAVLPFCSGLVGAAAGFLAWRVGSRRLPAFLAAAFSLTVAWIAMSPHLARFPWYISTDDGSYNRASYAFLVIALIILFLPARRDEGDRRERRDDAIVGAILAGLLFTKVSYFIAGGGLCGVAFLLGSGFQRRIPWALAAGFGAIFLLCLPLIRFDLAGMFADLRMAARARSALPQSAFTLATYSHWLTDPWREIALLAFMQALLRAPLFFRRRELPGGGRRSPPSWAELAGLIAVNAFISNTNSTAGSHSETPLLASWLFVLVGCAMPVSGVPPAHEGAPALSNARLAEVSLLAGAQWALTFAAGAVCLYWAFSPWPTAWQRSVAEQCPPFAAKPLDGFQVPGTGNEPPMPYTYAGKVNDGLQLLRKLGGTHRVAALDFVNPFPFAMQWPAARGDLWCWDNGYSFSLRSHPPAEEVFGDADILVIPKYPGAASFPLQLRLYGEFIKTHFEQIDQSGCWFVLRRK